MNNQDGKEDRLGTDRIEETWVKNFLIIFLWKINNNNEKKNEQIMKDC